MLEASHDNPWKQLNRREIYRSPWTCMCVDHLQTPGGEEADYAIILPRDYTMICPLHADGSVTLVRQWRYAFGCSSWELPCGANEANEADSPRQTAERELAEEAGLRAARWTDLGRFNQSDARVAGHGYLFLAEDLEELETAPERDSTEADMIIERVPMQEALAACEDGRISNITTMYALYRVARIRNL